MVTRKFKQKAADVTLPGVRLIGLFLYVHAPLHGTFPHPGFTHHMNNYTDFHKHLIQYNSVSVIKSSQEFLIDFGKSMVKCVNVCEM